MKKTLIVLMALTGMTSAESLNYGDAAFQSNSELMNGIVVSYDFDTNGTSYVSSTGLKWQQWIGGNTDVDFAASGGVMGSGGSVYTNTLGDAFDTGSFTISFDLISTKKTTDFGCLLSLYSSNAGYASKWSNAMTIRDDTNGNLVFALSSGGATSFDGKTTGIIQTGISANYAEPEPITITIVSSKGSTDGTGTLTLYINGSQKGDTITGWNAKDLTGIAFGDVFGGGAGTGGQTIDNLNIWNTALSSQAVAALVPEPTTATLSLLALCGLAARRRRK